MALRLATLLAVLTLVWRWWHQYVQGDSSWYSDLVDGSLLLLIAGVQSPEVSLGVFFPGLLFTSLYGTYIRAAVRILTYLLAYVGAAIISGTALVTPATLMPIPGFVFIGLSLALTHAALSNYEQAVLREQILRHEAEVLAETLLGREERLSALQTVAAALASTCTPAEIGERVMSIGALVLNAPVSSIRTVSADGAWLEQVASSRQNKELGFALRRPITDAAPSCEAVRTGRPVWLESAAQVASKFPGFARDVAPRGYRASAGLPLCIEGKTIGAMGLLFREPRQFSHDDREFLTAVAGLIAQALDRARLYVEEQARAQAAEDLARMRGDFVASVSHELRTPLTAIVGYAELLEARWTSMDEVSRREHLRRIVWSANRQVRLVQDLLLVSRLDLDALSLDCSATNMASQVDLAVTEVQGSYSGQQVQTSGPRGVLVHADPARFTQILVNLLDNAAKYSPEGSLIDVSWEVEATDVKVLVRDHGPGIPAESQARLFTRFGRLAGSPIRQGRMGTGLGLFLGRQLAQAMDGTLELAETGPQGSTFCVRLRLALDEQPVQASAQSVKDSAAGSNEATPHVISTRQTQA